MHISPAHTQSAGSGRALPEGTREKRSGQDAAPFIYMITYTIYDGRTITRRKESDYHLSLYWKITTNLFNRSFSNMVQSSRTLE